MIESLPDEPMATLIAAMAAIEVLSLQLSPCRVLAYRESLPSGLLGAHIAVIGERRRYQIALLTDAGGCRTLSSLLAGVERSDSGVSSRAREVLCDVVWKVANSFAGRLDRGALLPGLPLFVEGDLHASRTLRVQAADVALGSTRALLALVSSRGLSHELRGGH